METEDIKDLLAHHGAVSLPFDLIFDDERFFSARLKWIFYDIDNHHNNHSRVKFNEKN
jgi:hypothetical protein